MDALAGYDYLQKDLVGPGLRELGFTGARGKFHLPNEAGDHAILAFQKDGRNTRDSCRFTINLAFYRHDDWELARATESWLPIRPTTTGYPSVGWDERIGFLMTPPGDYCSASTTARRHAPSPRRS